MSIAQVKSVSHKEDGSGEVNLLILNNNDYRVTLREDGTPALIEHSNPGTELRLFYDCAPHEVKAIIGRIVRIEPGAVYLEKLPIAARVLYSRIAFVSRKAFFEAIESDSVYARLRGPRERPQDMPL